MSKFEDGEISLPPDTLRILNEFILKKAEQEQEERDRMLGISKNCRMFNENWQLSQFWYSEQTKNDFGKVVKKLLKPENQVALLSCPSLYNTIKQIHYNVKIFEFDKRFSIYGDDFILYDFNEAFDNPKYLKEHGGIYDLIIADPPFLSEECILKTTHIVKELKKPDGKIILSSGKVVEQWVKNFLDLQLCSFRPQHERNLGNEFVTYANFNLNEII